MGFPACSDGKASACNAGDPGSIPGLGRPAGGGHGNPPQHSCLENPMDRGAWWATVHGVTESRTQRRTLSLSIMYMNTSPFNYLKAFFMLLFCKCLS